MHSITFYIMSWAISSLMVAPIFLMGVVYIFVTRKKPVKKSVGIGDMKQSISSIKSREEFQSVLERFKSKYGVFKLETKQLSVWMECISTLASFPYWDTDAVAAFGQELEDMNPNHKKSISNTISVALKNKDYIKKKGN